MNNGSIHIGQRENFSVENLKNNLAGNTHTHRAGQGEKHTSETHLFNS